MSLIQITEGFYVDPAEIASVERIERTRTRLSLRSGVVQDVDLQIGNVLERLARLGNVETLIPRGTAVETTGEKD